MDETAKNLHKIILGEILYNSNAKGDSEKYLDWKDTVDWKLPNVWLDVAQEELAWTVLVDGINSESI